MRRTGRRTTGAIGESDGELGLSEVTEEGARNRLAEGVEPPCDIVTQCGHKDPSLAIRRFRTHIRGAGHMT